MEVDGGTGDLMEDYEFDCNDLNGWFEWDCEYVRKRVYYYLRGLFMLDIRKVGLDEDCGKIKEYSE